MSNSVLGTLLTEINQNLNNLEKFILLFLKENKHRNDSGLEKLCEKGNVGD